MKECGKSIARRIHQPSFTARYFVGTGIDIGGLPDPLSLYSELFPLMKSVRVWDVEDGDAQLMVDVPDAHYDFVHSSHCLEHLKEPREALRNWFRILKPGGHLVVTVPDEDLYEQGEFPSTFNRDHKWTFTIHKERSWSLSSVNLLDLVLDLGAGASLEKLELLDSSYRYELPRFDQTLTPIGECGIELVLRKRTPEELDHGGLIARPSSTSRETRIHLNQYQDDHRSMKAASSANPPFQNDDEL